MDDFDVGIRDLITYINDSGVKTKYSCEGHENKGMLPYVVIDVPLKNLPHLIKVLSNVKKKKFSMNGCNCFYLNKDLSVFLDKDPLRDDFEGAFVRLSKTDYKLEPFKENVRLLIELYANRIKNKKPFDYCLTTLMIGFDKKLINKLKDLKRNF
ncbi:MAG: hypothetical protein WC307_02745 [Candidatus Nanoarchaeia archaeon]|jgi:hypothetical protein